VSSLPEVNRNRSFPPLRRFLSAAITIVSLLLTTHLQAQPITIDTYRPIFRPVIDRKGTPLIAIRSFRRTSIPCYLLVDPATLITTVAPAASVTPQREAVMATLGSTPYLQALQRFTAPPYKLQNHGATRAERPVAGTFVTVDLCPSKRQFERQFFESLIKLGEKGGPAPVAVAVSGFWLERHGEELAWLMEQEARGSLAITWVNHSDHHPYDPRLLLEHNFLLTAGTDFLQEVLNLEVKLLERGLVPSSFFRFPGLVADGTLLGTLRDLGLIPLGSDAWLAKGEQPLPGSFILVHGNGNEPQGIKKFNRLFKGVQNLPILPITSAFGDQ